MLAIDNVQYPGGELTDAFSVKDIIFDVFNPDKGDRLAVQNILIVIIDGCPAYPDELWAIASAAVQADRIGIFLMCITPGCTVHFMENVSSPPKRVSLTITVTFQSGPCLME